MAPSAAALPATISTCQPGVPACAIGSVGGPGVAHASACVDEVRCFDSSDPAAIVHDHACIAVYDCGSRPICVTALGTCRYSDVCISMGTCDRTRSVCIAVGECECGPYYYHGVYQGYCQDSSEVCVSVGPCGQITSSWTCAAFLCVPPLCISASGCDRAPGSYVVGPDPEGHLVDARACSVAPLSYFGVNCAHAFTDGFYTYAALCPFSCVTAVADLATSTACAGSLLASHCIDQGEVVSRLLDIDDDGVTNLDELQAHSDPTDPASRPWTDDDGDGCVNASEYSFLTAKGIEHPRAHVGIGGTYVDPDTLDSNVDPEVGTEGGASGC